MTEPIIKADGSLEWYDENGKLHREDDLPALIMPQIYMYGKPHVAERRYWYKHGKLHRDGDKPAVITIWEKTNRIGSETWYSDGVLHRDNNDLPAFIAYSDKGVAIISNWVQNGQSHRLSGPAYIRFDGETDQNPYSYWAYHGNIISDGYNVGDLHRTYEK